MTTPLDRLASLVATIKRPVGVPLAESTDDNAELRRVANALLWERELSVEDVLRLAALVMLGEEMVAVVRAAGVIVETPYGAPESHARSQLVQALATLTAKCAEIVAES